MHAVLLITKLLFTLRVWFTHPVVKQIYESNSNKYHAYYFALILISFDGSDAPFACLYWLKGNNLQKQHFKISQY